MVTSLDLNLDGEAACRASSMNDVSLVMTIRRLQVLQTDIEIPCEDISSASIGIMHGL